MSTQISLKLSDKMFETAKEYADEKGYEHVQDFIRELVREKLFEDEKMKGIATYLASEKALAKRWLSNEEEEAWKHLQQYKKETSSSTPSPTQTKKQKK